MYWAGGRQINASSCVTALLERIGAAADTRDAGVGAGGVVGADGGGGAVGVVKCDG